MDGRELLPGHTPSPILLLGVGNLQRGDDGIGPVVVEKFQAVAPSGVTCRTVPGDISALLDAWHSYSNLLLVDAVVSGAAAGTLHRIPVQEGRLPAAVRVVSSHAMGVSEAIPLAHRLGLLPKQVLLLGVEGVDFQVGHPLSPRVAAAIPRIIAQIGTELALLQGDGHQPDELREPPVHPG